MKIYQQIIRPTLVLVLIASLVAAALALTYNLAGVEKPVYWKLLQNLSGTAGRICRCRPA